MEALKILLSSPIGLLSLFTIVFIIGMGIFFVRYASQKMDEDGKNAGVLPK